jgi:hypothetical protein
MSKTLDERLWIDCHILNPCIAVDPKSQEHIWHPKCQEKRRGVKLGNTKKTEQKNSKEEKGWKKPDGSTGMFGEIVNIMIVR